MTAPNHSHDCAIFACHYHYTVPLAILFVARFTIAPDSNIVLDYASCFLRYPRHDTLAQVPIVQTFKTSSCQDAVLCSHLRASVIIITFSDHFGLVFIINNIMSIRRLLCCAPSVRTQAALQLISSQNYRS